MIGQAYKNAQAAWGALPDWVAALAEECDRTSQGKAAARIKYSKTAVNRVLKNNYPDSEGGVEAACRRVFMAGSVACPVMGNISGDDCLHYQKRPFTSGNHMSVRLYRACHGDCIYKIINQKIGEKTND